jgi:4-hydroxythreonine-4-phosphate dehydrogenase
MVTADDRTGALETAAELADVVGPVVVAAGQVPPGSAVVDLGTRGELPAQAAERVAGVPAAAWNAHKMDSTLRGNWAHEIRARVLAVGRRGLVVPAWPAMGRTCVDGVVHVHGAAVGAVREHLPEATPLADVAALRRWLDGGALIGVVDVADADGLLAVADALVGADLLLAGPAGAIGEAYAARFGPRSPATRPTLVGPLAVVCGSATALSVEQLRRLRAADPEVRVIAAPEAEEELDVSVAVALAEQAAPWLAAAGTLLIVGGDTAAAVLGDAPRLVGGNVLPGMPWSRDADGGGPVVVTKAGAFGDVDTLVRLARLLQPPD